MLSRYKWSGLMRVLCRRIPYGTTALPKGRHSSRISSTPDRFAATRALQSALLTLGDDSCVKVLIGQSEASPTLGYSIEILRDIYI